ncbi:hypothetical protein LU11_gp325 [Pseudomonas phage Lu11]|uniref:hypothetical protein n=1 Tax=Pseudomonas phage Lu11 TaxID=1161927 RepID=UPI00025F186F|nr:hypothetical protein LU11_gp325 [Pseudomonas phage Lu11]AFH14856.1 hypothetical protein Lu11_0318 [Pseudomonas phage Lu11]
MPKILIDVPDDLLHKLVVATGGEKLEQAIVQYMWLGLNTEELKETCPVTSRFNELVKQIDGLPVGEEFTVSALTDGEQLEPMMKKMLGRRLARKARTEKVPYKLTRKTNQGHSVYVRTEAV